MRWAEIQKKHVRYFLEGRRTAEGKKGERGLGDS